MNFICLKSASTHLCPAPHHPLTYSYSLLLLPKSSLLGYLLVTLQVPAYFLPKTSSTPEWVRMPPSMHSCSYLSGLNVNCLQPPMGCEFHEGKSHVLGSTTSLAPSPKREQGIIKWLCMKVSTHLSAHLVPGHKIIT